MGHYRTAPKDPSNQAEKRFYKGPSLSPVGMLSKLFYRKWVFLGIVAASVALSVAYIVLSSPVYKADALIKFDRPERNMHGSLAGELDVVRSRAVFLKAMDATVAQAVVSVKNHVPLVGGFLSTILPREPNGLVDARFSKPRWAWGGEHIVFKLYEVPNSRYGQTLGLNSIGDGKWALSDTDGRELLRGTVGTLSQADGFKVDIAEMVALPGTQFTIVREPAQTRLEEIEKTLSAAEAKGQEKGIQLSFENVEPIFAARFVDAIAAAYVASRTTPGAGPALVEKALVPVRPVKPKRASVLLLGAVFGAVLGFIATQLIPFRPARTREPKHYEALQQRGAA
jgi:tyrosine-protein kinase Etk/Wzc